MNRIAVLSVGSTRNMLAAIAMLIVVAGTARGESLDVAALTRTIRQVGPKGQGHREAMVAWQTLSRADVDQLTEILAGMDDANPLAVNWLRAAAETVAQRTLAQGGKLPIADLEAFIAQTGREPRARRLAYELIAGVDPGARQRLIPGLLNDPSLELRRDAVAMALDKAAAIEDPNRAIVAYREILTASRAPDQVKLVTAKLEALGQKVDLPRHFGFVMRWHLVAPFDNTGTQGFDVAYPPERQVDLQATYAGKEGDIPWVRHETTDPYGVVDLNEVLGKHKGAIAYAYSEFVSDRERDVELRLGCINGNKIWLNGQLLTANHVYHAGMEVDQYKAKARLRPGRNQILLKIAQNEQTENWAQRWQFQLRVCDQFGTAVLSQDRPLEQAAFLVR
ncbi:MAG: hypothetical protein J5I93_04910 [Pirellulaceae bacterium]|nr:hypothetical protein [Pirellulaceae bacterium]